MPLWLANHIICELYHAIIFYYVLNLSTILVHSITLPVHELFDTIMEKSEVETRSSEQTMLSDEAHVLLVMDSSLEEDSETDDHSYLPHEVFALTWHADVGNIMHMVPCIAYCIHQRCHLLSLDMLSVNAICLVSLSYM